MAANQASGSMDWPPPEPVGGAYKIFSATSGFALAAEVSVPGTPTEGQIWPRGSGKSK